MARKTRNDDVLRTATRNPDPEAPADDPDPDDAVDAFATSFLADADDDDGSPPFWAR